MQTVKTEPGSSSALRWLDLGDVRILHKGLALVLIPVILSLLFLFSLFVLVDHADQELDRQVRALQVESLTAEIAQGFFEASSITAVYPFTRQASMRKRYEVLRDRSRVTFERLIKLLDDKPKLKNRLSHMRLMQTRAFTLLDELVKDKYSLPEAFDFIVLPGVREQAQSLLQQFVYEQTAFRKLHRESLNGGKPDIPAGYAANVKTFAILGPAATIPLATLLVFYISLGITRRLNTVIDNASRFSSSRPLNSQLNGTDEIGRLDSVFHQMARTLAETQRRERAIVENASDVICSLDQANNFTEVSDASTQVWGFEPQELLDHALVEFLVPEDVPDTLSTLNRMDGTKRSVTCENRVKRKDGSVVDMLWSITWSPENCAYFCVAHEITERKAAENLLKASEERIRTIVESMPVALFISDINGRIEQLNTKARQMFGLENLDIVASCLKPLFRDLANLEDLEFMKIVEEQWLGKVVELTASKNDGSEIPLELSVTSFDYRDKRKYLIVGIDVSERHAVQRWKQEFIQMVSHDLRTPLSSMQGTLSMIPTGIFGELNQSGRTAVELCERELDRLMALIDQLLDLEKLEAGKMKMDLDEIDIPSVVERSTAAVSYLAQKNGIKIEAPTAQGAKAFADESKLVQVLVNLLSNDIKFSPAESTITIDYRVQGDLLEFSVKDEGRGIPQSALSAVFERFKQVEAADHAEKSGKGLGLAICKEIVEAHGGRIWAESEFGKGSTFKFVVPQEGGRNDS